MYIGIVIVTYNRLEKLKKCLSAYERQTYSPIYICVIDNHSTDGTKEYLDIWKNAVSPVAIDKIVIYSESNLGGSGGFCRGIETALNLNADWIWLADDDAYPADDCLEQIYQNYTSFPQEEQVSISALCAKVVDNNGISPLHRRRLNTTPFQIKEIPFSESDYASPVNEITFFSFVGTAIRTDVIRLAGLPLADYFILFDDSEYSLRISKYGKILCISDAVILHDSLENTIPTYNWKNYYMFRNKLYTYRLYFNKRYVFIEFTKMIYMILVHFNNFKTWKQFYCSIRDCIAGKLGKNEKYLP